MKFLLDTCAVSELQRPKRNPGLVAAMDSIPRERMFISVLTIGEIEKGIEPLPSGERRRNLEVWVLRLLREYEGRLISFDLNEAQMWGRMLARMKVKKLTASSTDGLIAATAIANGLTLVTRNEGDFEGTGCMVYNPWA